MSDIEPQWAFRLDVERQLLRARSTWGEGRDVLEVLRAKLHQAVDDEVDRHALDLPIQHLTAAPWEALARFANTHHCPRGGDEQ